MATSPASSPLGGRVLDPVPKLSTAATAKPAATIRSAKL
jgi:hypothetical protein